MTPAGVLSRTVRLLPKLLLLALFVPFVAYAVPPVVGAEQSYVVLSGSMEPAISPGDVVFAYETDPAAISEGDVITFRRGSGEIPVTHRVVEVLDVSGEETAFRTRGDANGNPDAAPVSASNVIGRVPTVSLPVVGPVLVHVPYLGYLVEIAGTQYGYLALIVLPVVLLITSEARSLLRSGDDSSDGDGSATDGNEAPNDAPSPADAAETTPTDGAKTFTVSTNDLTLTFAVVLLVAVYSGFMAYRVRSPLAVSAAVAAIGSACLIGSLKYFGDPRSDVLPEDASTAPSPDDDTTGSNSVPDPPHVHATLASDASDPTRIALSTHDDLEQIADTRDAPIRSDPDTGADVLVAGDFLFVAPATEDPNADGDDDRSRSSTSPRLRNGNGTGDADADRGDEAKSDGKARADAVRSGDSFGTSPDGRTPSGEDANTPAPDGTEEST
jgi:signal peptidase